MLFDPIRIGKLELDSRLIMPPLQTGFANQNGSVSQRMIDHYARRAESRPALIVVECTSVDSVHRGRFQPSISDDDLIEGFRRLADAIKRHGVKAALQIQHPGRQLALPTVQAVAPSPVASRSVPRLPRELSLSEVEGLVESFAAAARRAREAGFDAVQFHGAHGYLIAQFMSAWSNKRGDRYGGDVRGRASFALEIIRRTRREVGGDYPLIFRFSADEYLPEGRTIEESKILAQLLESEGIDAISVSAGAYDSGEWTSQPMLLPRACLAPLAAEIKSVVTVPVAVAGRIHTPRVAEAVLARGQADLIAMGRPLFADPDLPRKAREGRERDIRHCISCNVCMQSVSSPDGVTCLVNPDLGRDGQTEARSPKPRRVLVINGGPAGIEAARVAALRGHEVTLWDARPRLDGRWSWLLRPYLANRLDTLARLGVTVKLAVSVTRGAVADERPDVVVAGRGLRPAVPSIPGMDNVAVVQADDILEGRAEATGDVVVLGAGNVGFEIASFLARRGHRIRLIEEGRTLGTGIEPLTRNVMRRQLVGRGVGFHRNARVVRVGPDAVDFVDESGVQQKLAFDSLVIANDGVSDEELIESLRGNDYELIPVGPCQQPIEYGAAFREGTAIGRRL